MAHATISVQSFTQSVASLQLRPDSQSLRQFLLAVRAGLAGTVTQGQESIDASSFLELLRDAAATSGAADEAAAATTDEGAPVHEVLKALDTQVGMGSDSGVFVSGAGGGGGEKGEGRFGLRADLSR